MLHSLKKDFIDKVRIQSLWKGCHIYIIGVLLLGIYPPLEAKIPKYGASLKTTMASACVSQKHIRSRLDFCNDYFVDDVIPVYESIWTCNGESKFFTKLLDQITDDAPMTFVRVSESYDVDKDFNTYNYTYQWNVEDVLYKTETVTNGRIQYELSMFVNADFFVEPLKTTEYSSQNTVTLKANSGDVVYPKEAFVWEYRIGNGTIQEYPERGSEIQVSLADLPFAQIGDNIFFRLKSRQTASDFVVFRFYAALPSPRPHPINTQTINSNETQLKILKIEFDRLLNPELEEKITVITIYDSMAQFNYNGVPIPEARIKAQFKNLNISSFSSAWTCSIDLLAKGINLEEGKYYISAEGTVRNRSSALNASHNSGFLSKEAQTAMFKLQEFRVVKSVIKTTLFQVDLPKCNGGTANFNIEIENPTSYGPLTNYTFYKDGRVWTPTTYKTRSTNMPIKMYHIFTFNEIPAASYSIRIESNESTPKTLSFNLNIPNPLPIETSINKADISGIQYKNGIPESSKDGWVYVRKNQTKNGIPPYEYTYYINGSFKGSIMDTLKFQNATIYDIEIKDANNCVRRFSDRIVQLKDTLRLQLTAISPQCNERDDGSLSAKTNIGKIADFTWMKDGVLYQDKTDYMEGLGGGLYQVVVVDRNTRLKSFATIRLQAPEKLSVVASCTNVKCKGEAQGAIDITGYGGVKPYMYSWEHGAYSSNLTNLKAGDYILKLRDANACELRDVFTVKEPQKTLQIDNVKLIHPYYKTSEIMEMGSITLYPDGGTKPYTFLWNPYSNRQNLTNLTAGNYSLTIRDANNCKLDAAYALSLIPPVQSTLKVSSPTCHNSQDAHLFLEPAGGRSPYTIQWSNGANGNTLMGLSEGVYTATITDAFGATAEYRMQVDAPPPLTIKEALLSQPTYYGASQGAILESLNDASIRIQMEGGTPPYTYQWYKENTSGNSFVLEGNTADLSALSSGKYRLQASDQNACEIEQEFIIEDRQALVAKIKIEDSVRCFGEANAILQAQVLGGVPPYTYQWSKAGDALWKNTTQKCIGLSKGIYSLLVTDFLGVQSDYQIELKEPEKLQIAAKSLKEPDYYGSVDGAVLPALRNGRILLNPTGGNGNYTYQWSHQSYTELGAEGMLMQNLEGNTYIVRIKDKRACQVEDTTVLVAYSALVSEIIEISSIQCYGSNEGALRVKFSGGKPPYQYEWSDFSNETFISGLTSSYYVVTVTDANNIKSSHTYFLSQPPQLHTNIQIQNSLCADDFTGSMSAEVTGGVLPYTFLWSNGDTTRNVKGFENISLQVKVQDANACKSSANASLAAPLPLALIADTVNPSYQGVLYQNSPTATSDGQIELHLSGGIAPYSYIWSHGEHTAAIHNLKEDMYTVLVRDANYCELQKSFYLKALPNLHARLNIEKEIDCYGDANGIIQANTEGGLPPYTYQWQDLPNKEDLFKQAQKGVYKVIVTDKNGIISLDSIFIDEPLALSMQLVADSVSGWGASDGAVNAYCTGGTFPYTYQWNTNDTVSFVKDLKSGVYTLCLRDKNGCLLTKNIKVHSPDSLTHTYTLKHCTYFGAQNGNVQASLDDGRIDVFIKGGVAPYTYKWMNLGTQSNIVDSLSQGYYYLEVTDKNAYSLRDTFYIHKAAPLSASIELKSQILCAGDSNGQLLSRVQGGNAPYQYRWSHGARDSIASSLSANDYFIEVEDAKGVVATAHYFLWEPKPLEVNLIADSTLGFGRCDGKVSAVPSGGTFPYSYLWSNATSDSNIDSICAASYSLLLQDSLHCQVYKEIEVYSPDPLSVEADIKHCDYFGAENGNYQNALNNGFIKLRVEGGVAPYQYLWESGHRQASIFGLFDTLYTLTIIDKNGNFIKDSFRIEKPLPLIADILITKPLKCYGDSLGELKALVSGGRPPYTCTWNDGSSDSLLKHLKSAWYEVKIKDSLGVVSTRKFYFPQAEIFKVYAKSDSLTGADRKDGVVYAWAEGGSMPYTYLWQYEDRFFEGAEWKRLEQGLYHLKAHDSNACVDSLMILVSAPMALELETEIKHCSYGGSEQLQADSIYQDGSIYIRVQGGTPPYTYKWKDGATSNQRENLAPATYLVTVSDAYNIAVSQLIEIKRPDFLRTQILLQKLPDCAGASDGVLNSETNGGVKPYAYTWYVQQDTGEDMQFVPIGEQVVSENLKSGYYKLEVVDSLGIQSDYTYYLKDALALKVQRSLYPPSCHGFNNGKIVLQTQGGLAPYAYKWDDLSEGAIRSELKVGKYIFEVKDAKNCSFRDTIYIEEPQNLSIQKQIDSPLCFGAKGKISINANGGIPPYNYRWKGFAADSVLENVTAGLYILKLTDSNQCVYEEEIEMREPSALRIEKTSKAPLCYGGDDGSLKIYIKGGVKPYLYQWENGVDSDSIRGLKQGSYTVKITDSNQCVLYDTISIYQPNKLNVKEDVYAISCFGSKDGHIHLNASGGRPPYQYRWASGESFSDLSDLDEAYYYYRVKDANDCVYQDSIYISQADLLQGTIRIQAHTYTGNNAFIQGVQNQDAKIYVEMQGGRTPYTYHWSSGETIDSLVNLSYGKYSLYVTDSSNCKWMQEIEVKERQALYAKIESFQALKCYGDANGSLIAKIKGGIPPYKIRWNTGDTNLQIENLHKALYILNVSDSLGVTAIDSFDLKEPIQPQLTYIIEPPICHAQTNASIEVKIEGASFPYALQWSTGQKTNKISSIAAGSYFLHIVDKNQCVYSDTVILEEREKVNIQLEITEPLCRTQAGSIWVSGEGGVSPYYFIWQNQVSNSSEALLSRRIENASAGLYVLQVKDQNNCMADTQFILKNPPKLDLGLADRSTFCIDKYVELKPEIDYIFDEYAYSPDEWSEKYADSLIYLWTLPNGEMLFEKEIHAETQGIYHLTLMEYGGCMHRDSTQVIESLDSISSDFWISTQVEINDIVLAVNVSSPKADSIVWIVPDRVYILKAEGEYAELQFTDTGTYEIVLHSYKNDCFESKYTQVRVNEKPYNYKQGEGVEKTLFSKISISPNPSSLASTLNIVLNKESTIYCRLIEIASGKMVYTNQFSIVEGQEFSHVFEPELFQAGVYLLVLESAKEVKTIKIVRI